MSDSLRDQLAAIGIRGGEDIELPPLPLGDQIDEMIRAALPWSIPAKAWLPPVIKEAHDLHDQLEAWQTRLAFCLQLHGIKSVTEFETPQVPANYSIGGVQGTEKCKHELVRVNETVGALLCRQCKMPVNPVWWVARFTDRFSKAEHWMRHMRAEAQKLAGEIDHLKKERSKFRQAEKRAREAAVKAEVQAAAPALKKRRRRTQEPKS